MSHWYCPACQHVWDDHQPDAMEIDATTPDDVVKAFVLPGDCPKCGNWQTTVLTKFQAQVMAAALAPAARTLHMTDDTSDEELSAFIRGEPYPPPGFDPDNPPLTGKEVWSSGREQVLKRIAAHRTRRLARQIDAELETKIAAARTLLRDSAIEIYLSDGMTQADAEVAADTLLNSPAQFLLPLLDELDTEC